MPVHQIQPTFSGGEFSPALYSRVDLQKYATGLKKAKNFIIHPHGGASNRAGSLFVASSRDPSLQSRLVPFEFSTEQSYVLEFGEKYIRFYMNGAPIAMPTSPAWSAAGAYEFDDIVTYNGSWYRAQFYGTLATPPDQAPLSWIEEADGIYTISSSYLASEIWELKFTQSADILYVVHPDYLPRQLTRFDHDLWTLDRYEATEGPFMLMNTTETHKLTASGTAKNASITLTSNIDFFTDEMTWGPGLFLLSHDIPGQSIIADLSATGATSSIKCGKTWRITTTGTWQGALKLETSLDSGTTWKELRAFSSGAGAAAMNLNTFGDEPEYCLIRVNVTSYTTGPVHINLTTDPFTQEGIVRCDTRSTVRIMNCTVLKEIGANTATPDWAEGSWSGENGFPSSVIFYQDRLIFAGSRTEPQTIWASETGIYTSFARSSPLVESDGVTINLPSRKMNGIKSMVGLAEILALTSSTEWSVGPGSSGVFSPTSVETKVEGYRGSNSVDPVVIGNRAVYVQPMGSVLRDLGYDFSSNGFAGMDLSILSNHLFEGYEITDMCYQQEPDSIVWCVRSDGKLLSLTYVREHEVLAWTWHETDGLFESVCSIPGDGFNELWAVVNRGGNRIIERFVHRMASTEPRDQHFLDCGLIYDEPKAIEGISQSETTELTITGHGLQNDDVVILSDIVGPTDLNGQKYIVADASTDTFEIRTYPGDEAVDSSAMPTFSVSGYSRLCASILGGLTHLEGKTVSILADGNVIPSQVVSGGQIDISTSGTFGTIHVGLPYTADLETLNIEVNTQDGTMQGRLMKVSEVTMRFLNSRGGYVGPDENNLTEIVQRTGEPLGSAIDLFTGDQKETLTSSYDAGGRVFFRQVDPLPVTILAVMPTVTVGG
jgi:hypothetical protein